MIRVSGQEASFNKTVTPVTAVAPPDDAETFQKMGIDPEVYLKNAERNPGARVEPTIGNSERPSNLWYKITGMANYWRMYAMMDWYKSEVSVFSTVIQRSTTELFRYGLDLKPKFALKCEDCDEEYDGFVSKCPHCGSTRLRKPDPTQKDYFRRPNGKSFLEEANENGQSLKDVLRAYAESQYQNNQAYTLCVTGDIYDKVDGHLLRSYPLEFICQDPKFVKYLYDETGKPGTTYAFTREDRNTLINLDQNPNALNDYTEEGIELYPAIWQIGSNYGGTGKYWLYTQEEVYQDHWFRPSLIYGVPIWYDIEDDLQTYHFIEKHNLKKYKYGYVRKMVILPGFNEEDVEDITKGIRDILATNDNSIPIICTPPQLPGTAEMKAQTLELGTESSADLMAIKDDIRDRICAHAGVPNLFAGDVEASGGMNNESQQITIFDRFLVDKLDYVDRQCKWIMSWFPKITDYELVVNRPGKADVDAKQFLEEIQKAQMMKQLGFDVYRVGSRFYFSEEPVDQIQRKQQEAMAQQQQAMPATEITEGGIVPGDGDGPPEKGTARRENSDIGDVADEIDQSKREADATYEL